MWGYTPHTHASFKETRQRNTKCLNKQNFKTDFFEFGVAYLILEFRISPKQQQQLWEAFVCCNLKITFRSLRCLFCKSGSLHHKKKKKNHNKLTNTYCQNKGQHYIYFWLCNTHMIKDNSSKGSFKLGRITALSIQRKRSLCKLFVTLQWHWHLRSITYYMRIM